MRVINFSGGRTSALMTILLEPTQEDIVLFCDTGLEHPATYKFIDDFEKHEGIKVHRAYYSKTGIPFLKLVEKKKYVPNRTQRFCTSELKVKTAKRFLRAKGIISFDSYIGFRYDEKSRVDSHVNRYSRVKVHFPLYDQRINEAQVLEYWRSKPYDLQIPRILGNCTLCPLKGKNAILNIMSQFPELAAPFLHMEEMVKDIGHRKRKGTFINGVSYKTLFDLSQRQKTLFDLEQIQPAYSCSCTAV